MQQYARARGLGDLIENENNLTQQYARARLGHETRCAAISGQYARARVVVTLSGGMPFSVWWYTPKNASSAKPLHHEPVAQPLTTFIGSDFHELFANSSMRR